ncbi:hypothetical protein RMCBS344292_17321 [Rhizopus microsporus]|nr:hypothetical protein RMCBS344292_17321 [Rhizopus microsporus]
MIAQKPYVPKKRTGTKRKDTFDVINAKKDVKRRRQAATSETSSSTSRILCSSCQEEGHKSARSRVCRNYNLKLKELLQIKLGSNYQKYTVSIPFASFCRETLKKSNFLKKIKAISGFIREVILKAQLFVNYYILKHPNKLTNDFFEQNFWYIISRIVRAGPDKIKSILKDYRNRRKERPNEENLDVDQLTNPLVYLSSTTTNEWAKELRTISVKIRRSAAVQEEHTPHIPQSERYYNLNTIRILQKEEQKPL